MCAETLCRKTATMATLAKIADSTSIVSAAQDQLREGRVSVADYIPSATWAGMLAGIIADVTPYIQKALDVCSPGSTLYFPFCASGYHVSNPVGSIEKIFTLPAGVHVYMDDGVWIYPSTANAITTVLTPLGHNILRVNIDGQSLPENNQVGESPGEDRVRRPSQVWINFSFGVRAYASADLGLGADNVTIIDSRFRNLHHAVQTQACSHWKVVHNDFERIELAAILMSYLGGNSRYNEVDHNHFRNIGDCAIAWTSGFEPVFEAAYNSQSFNTAVDTNLNVQGFAFNVEPHNVDQQHHFRMIGNSVRQVTTGLPHGTGGCTMQNVGESVIAFNTLAGSLNSNGDYGISCLESRGMRLFGNNITNFRASGITMDGSTDAEVKDNVITDCGEGSSGTVYPSIQLGLHYRGRRIRVANNRIVYTDGYVHGAATCTAISLRTSGGPAQEIVIEKNEMVSPWGAGIFVNGLLAGGRAAALDLLNNKITRTDLTSVPSMPIQIYGADQVTITGTLLANCRYGYTAQSCDRVTISDGEITGPGPVLTLYDFTDSTNIRVLNMRCAPSVVTAVTGAGAGTVWENDDRVSLRGEVRASFSP